MNRRSRCTVQQIQRYVIKSSCKSSTWPRVRLQLCRCYITLLEALTVYGQTPCCLSIRLVMLHNFNIMRSVYFRRKLLRYRRLMSSQIRLSSVTLVHPGGDGPPLSGSASPVVPRRLLRAGLHGSWSPASAIRQSPSTHRSSRPSQQFRRLCFRHCGPNSLEFSAWQFAWSSCWAWSVSTWLENASVWVTLRLV